MTTFDIIMVFTVIILFAVITGKGIKRIEKEEPKEDDKYTPVVPIDDFID